MIKELEQKIKEIQAQNADFRALLGIFNKIRNIK